MSETDLPKDTQPVPGEHPLMSHRTLRAMYAKLAQAHISPRSAACWVSPLLGLKHHDLIYTGLPSDLLAIAQPPCIANPVHRLYAAIGAATVLGNAVKTPVAIVFFERHEADKAVWLEALPLAASLPLLLIVLPRSRGADGPTPLAKLSRAAGVPGIPVDGQDPIALYRVAQESLVRARAGGGAALIEAVSLPGSPTPLDKLADYLLSRSVVTPEWIARYASG